jgi:zinc protease
MFPYWIEYGKDAPATPGGPRTSNGVRSRTALIRDSHRGVCVIHRNMHQALRRVVPAAALLTLLFVRPSAIQAQSTSPSGGQSAPAATPALPQKVDPILDRYGKAIGGRATWEKFTSQVMLGTIQVPSMNLSGTIMIHQKAPDKFMSAVIINGAAFQQGFDGIQGWTDDPKNGLREQTGAELAEAKRGADFLHAFKMGRVYARIVVAGAEKIGDRDTWVLEATPPEGGDPTKMYFDTHSGLLLRVVSQNHDADGVTPLQEDFDDYRDVDGVKVPFLWRQTNGDTTYTLTFSEVHHDVDLSDSEFAKPAVQ